MNLEVAACLMGTSSRTSPSGSGSGRIGSCARGLLKRDPTGKSLQVVGTPGPNQPTTVSLLGANLLGRAP